MASFESPYHAFQDPPEADELFRRQMELRRQMEAEAHSLFTCGGQCRRWCHRLCRRLLCLKEEPEPRYIRLNAKRPTPHRFPSNRLVNTKYTTFNFLPKVCSRVLRVCARASAPPVALLPAETSSGAARSAAAQAATASLALSARRFPQAAAPLPPQVLFEQFSYFFNLYFLLVAASQFFPPLVLGLRFSYVAPLGFVLVVTMSKEAHDDRRRFKGDQALNLQSYARLLPGGAGATEQVHAQDVTVGQLLQIRTNQRVPADVVLLRTSEGATSGEVYLRTEQLDGETEWKLRRAVPAVQRLCPTDRALSACDGMLLAPRPSADTHAFSGHLVLYHPSLEGGSVQERLGLEHTMWANSVLASGTATGVVVHTGRETRAAANSAPPRSKVGSIDLQVNSLAKLLFVLTGLTALVMVSVPLLLRWLA